MCLSASRIGPRLLRRCIRVNRVPQRCVCASLEISSFRLVDYSTNYVADDWCHKGHIVFVVAGQLANEGSFLNAPSEKGERNKE